MISQKALPISAAATMHQSYFRCCLSLDFRLIILANAEGGKMVTYYTPISTLLIIMKFKLFPTWFAYQL